MLTNLDVFINKILRIKNIKIIKIYFLLIKDKTDGFNIMNIVS